MLEAIVCSGILTLWVMFGYQGALAIRGWRVLPGPDPTDALRIAVLIPAHDEEGPIGRLLASLRAVDYPRDRLFILVVADHCSDATAQVVRNGGVACLERTTGVRGKAGALSDGIKWLRHHKSDSLDAIAFFDADNIVEPDFFRFAAGRIAAGEPIVQGHVAISNWNVSLFTRLNHINATVENRFKELARSQAGFSCQLRGHGMVFRRSEMERFDWQNDSMAEDKGMVVRLVLAGKRAVWEERARVGSVLPTTTREAAVQRRRWSGGKSAVGRKAVRLLLRKWISDRDWVAFDLMIDFLIPSHAVQLSLVFVGCAAASLLVGPTSVASASAFALMGAYFGYFFLGSWRGGVPGRIFLTFFAAPFYILWRTWIYLTRFSGSHRWR